MDTSKSNKIIIFYINDNFTLFKQCNLRRTLVCKNANTVWKVSEKNLLDSDDSQCGDSETNRHYGSLLRILTT